MFRKIALYLLGSIAIATMSGGAAADGGMSSSMSWLAAALAGLVALGFAVAAALVDHRDERLRLRQEADRPVVVEQPLVPIGITDDLVADCAVKLSGHRQRLERILPVLRFVSKDATWWSAEVPSFKPGNLGVLEPYLSRVDTRRMNGEQIIAACRIGIADFVHGLPKWLREMDEAAETKANLETLVARKVEVDRMRFENMATLVLMGGWAALVAFIHLLSMHRPGVRDYADYANVHSLPSDIASGIDAILSNLPSQAAWDHRATVGTMVAVVAFAVFMPLCRAVAKHWQMPLAVAIAALFSVGAGEVGRATVFSYDAMSTCEVYDAAVAGRATLTTEDINRFDEDKCRLPPGFAMDRDMYRTTPTVQ